MGIVSSAYHLLVNAKADSHGYRIATGSSDGGNAAVATAPVRSLSRRSAPATNT